MSGEPPADPRTADTDLVSIGAIVLGGLAWVFLGWALLGGGDTFGKLWLAFLAGVAGLVLGLQARRKEPAVAAGAAAGVAVGYTALLATMLAAMVFVSGVALFFVVMFFLFLMFAASSSSSSSGGGWNGCGGGSRSDSGGGGCCCDDCCGPQGCCGDCADCGDCGCGACDCGCGACDCGCGGCDCGGCGGCGCAALVIPTVLRHAPPGPLLARVPWTESLGALLRRGIPHHPDEPAYAQDVFMVRGARWCIGCFTTYPVFLVATAILSLAAPSLAWSTALMFGAGFAGAQLISSAGLAKRRWMKVSVKTLLGAGLALVVVGVNAAPWHPIAKVAALGGTLALALLSAVPRARRMRRARRAGCSCESQSEMSTP